MTTLKNQRCAQCGVHYVYQASGHGCGRAENHPDWCPSCKGIVNAALACVPRKFEGRWRSIRKIPKYAEVTLEMVLAWEKEIFLDQTQAGLLRAQRIWPGLFNLETGDSMSIRLVPGRDAFQGTPFRLSTWKLSLEYEIEVEMEYDSVKKEFTGARWP